MKKTWSFIVMSFITIGVYAQNNLKVQKIVLENGFTVFLNENKSAKDVFGAVVVKAGSKNDPATATGMAHYLEHLLFKGTQDLGTTDYLKEKPYLDSINIYYDLLGKTTDVNERKKIQLLINNQSIQASKYGLPTEFDKLIKEIGGTGLNAFTQNDMTVYHNSFPGEQIEKWLDLYSHRFINPVFRSFQSELEVVYEEKNRGMDNFQWKLFETLNENLFKSHPYGTQSTIGTVEHLKNPSLTKMYEFFNTYYVANNMALVISGNFDAEKAIPFIREKFSKLRTGTVPNFPNYPTTVFTKKEVVNLRITPVKMELIAFKTIPSHHKDKAKLYVLNNLLSNESETGKLNKLQRDGKIMAAMSFDYAYNDDGAQIFFIIPKLVGQKLPAAEKLVLAEIEKIKKGEFTDQDLAIIKTELYRQKKEELEDPENIALALVEGFSNGTTWEEYLNFANEIDQITKQDIIDIANKYYGENYLVIRSKMGTPPKEKLDKPGFKPVVTDQKGESAYCKYFENMQINSTVPKFLDLANDAAHIQLNESNKLFVTKNDVNDIFTLKVVYNVGSDDIKNLDLASSLFNYFHTADLTSDQLKEEFAKLGLVYYANCSEHRFAIEFTGIERNYDKSLALINKLLQNPVVEDNSVKVIVEEVLTGRQMEEKQPQSMGSILFDYACYGPKSEYLTRLKKEELEALKAADLLNVYKQAIAYDAVWHYVGSLAVDQVKTTVAQNITLQNNKKSIALVEVVKRPVSENIIYVLNDPKAVQSQVYFGINSQNYTANPKLDAQISAFNEYMGGGFSGLILQEIREFRSLAYTAGGAYSRPKISNNPGFFYSFVGCQSDKTNDAIETMIGLLKEMPKKEERMNFIKAGLINSTAEVYPAMRQKSTRIQNLLDRGYTSNPYQAEYTAYNGLTYADIEAFFKSYVQGKPMFITVYGDTSKMDLTKLAQFGKIVTVEKTAILVK